MSKIENNTEKLDEIIEENKHLKREYSKLQDRLTRLETNQINNNVILIGLDEKPWENYKITEQRVLDHICCTKAK